MPVNPYQEQVECFAFIDKFLTKYIPEEGVHIKELLRQALVKYSVSKASIMSFIEECYIETEYIRREDNILFKNKQR